MRTHPATRFAILCCLLVLGSMTQAEQQANAPRLHTWTSVTGHRITASFVAIDGASLVLNDENGETRTIPLSLLTPSDQARAREHDQARTGEPKAQAEGSSPDRFPVFLSGDAKGYHAVHTHPHFTARVTDRGWIEIQCLADGKPVGEPIVFSFGHAYEDKQTNRHPRRRITEFKKMTPPTRAPRVLEYEATIQGGATIGLNYAFIDNSIQIWGWVVDPPGIKDPTTMRLSFSFKASHDFPHETPVAERKRVLAPCALVIQPRTGRTVRLPYADVVARFPESVQRMTIEGPVYGPRSVSISAQSPRNAELVLWNYRNYAPYQGYSVGLRKQNLASKANTERIIITID